MAPHTASLNCLSKPTVCLQCSIIFCTCRCKTAIGRIPMIGIQHWALNIADNRGTVQSSQVFLQFYTSVLNKTRHNWWKCLEISGGLSINTATEICTGISWLIMPDALQLGRRQPWTIHSKSTTNAKSTIHLENLRLC